MGVTLSIKEPGEKLRRAPTETLQTHLPQQSSSSAKEEEEDHRVLMEDKRRRRIAFENLAKEMLRYLDNCNDVKAGITELRERVGGAVAIRYLHSASGTAGDEHRWPTVFFFSKYSGKKKENYVLPAGTDGRRSGKAKSIWKEDVKT